MTATTPDTLDVTQSAVPRVVEPIAQSPQCRPGTPRSPRSPSVTASFWRSPGTCPCAPSAKAPSTLTTCGDGLRGYLAWCSRRDAQPVVRASLSAWVADLLDTGSAETTARSRQLAVRRFSAWLHAEGEIPADPFLGLKPPKIYEQVTEPHTVAELKALIAACTPPRGAEAKVKLRHVRDEAIIRLMTETGARAQEASI